MNASMRPWSSSPVTGSASWLPMISSMYFTVGLLNCAGSRAAGGRHHRDDERQSSGSTARHQILSPHGAELSGIVTEGVSIRRWRLRSGSGGRAETGPGWQTGVILMTQYLLALYMADGEKVPEEQTRRVWADVNALIDRMTDAGAYVFKSGLDGGGESATVVRPSGGDFVMTDGPY